MADGGGVQVGLIGLGGAVTVAVTVGVVVTGDGVDMVTQPVMLPVRKMTRANAINMEMSLLLTMLNL